MVWYFLLWCTKLNREVLVFLSKGYHSREENVCPANKTIMCTIFFFFFDGMCTIFWHVVIIIIIIIIILVTE